MSEINKVINELKEARYNIEDRSNITDYLGVDFKYLDKNTLELTNTTNSTNYRGFRGNEEEFYATANTCKI